MLQSHPTPNNFRTILVTSVCIASEKPVKKHFMLYIQIHFNVNLVTVPLATITSDLGLERKAIGFNSMLAF